ncbi:hypothetical protein TEA_016533 [Camellia sinensis var. sinensis]|uniref:pectinesterase n=1 Tax=Camellia sinensis var. sinensis TaxID=542762 RepID=A0A4S4DC70_CAMSN|nr:hypothetical protein TEA_016533 [Camellia sinensis var. sinensis]
MQIHSLTFIVFLLVSTCFGLSRAIECRVNVKNPSKYAYTITVDQTGKGNFVTIQKAVDSVPSNNDQWLRIHVHPGIYMEKVTIPKEKQCIFLEGSGYTQTTISGEDHSQTDSSATFTVLPDNFVAKGIAFMNSYNRPIVVDEVKPAVATRIYGDKAAFYDCAFLGFQDTLWDVEGRHYFNSCYIEGAIDFIWGDGQSFFEECRINVTAGLLPSQVSAGYITAQGRQSEEDPGGFVFENGYVFGTGQAYLGHHTVLTPELFFMVLRWIQWWFLLDGMLRNTKAMIDKRISMKMVRDMRDMERLWRAEGKGAVAEAKEKREVEVKEERESDAEGDCGKI